MKWINYDQVSNKNETVKAFLMPTLYDELEKDVRFREGMKACLNCGVCTAVCPAAGVSDYDPRMVVNTYQMPLLLFLPGI